MDIELKKRWITGLIALPILFVIIKFKLVFSIFCVIVALIAYIEYAKIVIGDTFYKEPVIIAGIIISPLMILFAHKSDFYSILSLIAINLFICALIAMIVFDKESNIFDIISKQILGFIYIPFLVSYMVLIRSSESGHIWIFFTLTMIFACDTGAYFAGKNFGKNKLCPHVSPGKTIEGFIGGLLSCMLAGAIFKFFFISVIKWEIFLFLSFAVGLIGPVGDLFESVLKRSSNIKDSGHILPGHGGILDRIDALLFAAPVVFYVKEMFV